MKQTQADNSTLLNDLILSLPDFKAHHVRGGRPYDFLKSVVRREIEFLLAPQESSIVNFGPFGELQFPYHRMGAVDSLNLFDMDEMIIFSFYWANRHRYRRALDIGANLGLHSILLEKCGVSVKAYEPDPWHYEIMKQNIDINNCFNVECINAAVSNHNGNMEFIRVLGNTTSSHLAGSKRNPYGELKRFPVEVKAIQNIIEWADFVKLDAEGHEKQILLATNRGMWDNIDAIVEIENEGNAEDIYKFIAEMGVNMFAQKLAWMKVEDVSGMPTSYKEGSLFITTKEEMPWN